MARHKRQENSLLSALRFVSCAQKSNGAIEQQYCRLFGRNASASNGVITASHPIQEDVQACPHTSTLIAALEECQDSFSLSVIDSATMAVKSGTFQALVSCIELSRLPAYYGDTSCITLSENFVDSC